MLHMRRVCPATHPPGAYPGNSHLAHMRETMVLEDIQIHNCSDGVHTGRPFIGCNNLSALFNVQPVVSVPPAPPASSFGRAWLLTTVQLLCAKHFLRAALRAVDALDAPRIGICVEPQQERVFIGGVGCCCHQFQCHLPRYRHRYHYGALLRRVGPGRAQPPR